MEPPAGVGRYLNRLLHHLGQTDGPFKRITVYTPGGPVGCDEIFRDSVELRIVPSRVPPLLWEHLLVAPRLRSAELIFGPYIVPLSRVGDSVVGNLEIYEGRQQDFPLVDRLRTTPFFWNSVRRVRLTIANSESTRSDLIRFYGAPREAVKVVHLGVDERFLVPGACGRLFTGLDPNEVRPPTRAVPAVRRKTIETQESPSPS